MTGSRRGHGVLAGAIAGLLLIVAFPGRAEAHAFPNVGDFYAGMLHPITSLDALLPFLALGALAGQQGRDAALRTLAVLPLMLLAGTVIGAVILGPPDVGPALLASLVLLGVLVAGGWTLPATLVIALAALVGALVGMANGAELAVGESVWRFGPGVAVSGLLVVAYVVGGVRWLSAPWTRIAVRVAGSWLAATGIMVLALGRW